MRLHVATIWSKSKFLEQPQKQTHLQKLILGQLLKLLRLPALELRFGVWVWASKPRMSGQLRGLLNRLLDWLSVGYQMSVRSRFP